MPAHCNNLSEPGGEDKILVLHMTQKPVNCITRVLPVAPFYRPEVVVSNFAAYTLQDAAINLSFCWLFAIFLAIDVFSGLPFLSEHVDDAQIIAKIFHEAIYVQVAHELNLLPSMQDSRSCDHSLKAFASPKEIKGDIKVLKRQKIKLWWLPDAGYLSNKR